MQRIKGYQETLPWSAAGGVLHSQREGQRCPILERCHDIVERRGALAWAPTAADRDLKAALDTDPRTASAIPRPSCVAASVVVAG